MAPLIQLTYWVKLPGKRNMMRTRGMTESNEQKHIFLQATSWLWLSALKSKLEQANWCWKILGALRCCYSACQGPAKGEGEVHSCLAITKEALLKWMFTLCFLKCSKNICCLLKQPATLRLLQCMSDNKNESLGNQGRESLVHIRRMKDLIVFSHLEIFKYQTWQGFFLNGK